MGGYSATTRRPRPIVRPPGRQVQPITDPINRLRVLDGMTDEQLAVVDDAAFKAYEEGFRAGSEDGKNRGATRVLVTALLGTLIIASFLAGPTIGFVDASHHAPGAQCPQTLVLP
jgi:hypothetical protein